jgi:hypothetical protein
LRCVQAQAWPAVDKAPVAHLNWHPPNLPGLVPG